MTQSTMTVSGVEVNGELVLAMVEGMRGIRKRYRHLLAEYGVDDPRPDCWYSRDELLDIFETISANVGPFVICDMGTRVADDARFPAEIDSVEKALTHAGDFFRDGHRGEKVGSYTFEKTGEGSGTMVCKTPYPCDFDRGLIEALALRFRPEGSWNVTVKHEETAACRKQGGDSCSYTVQW